MEKNLTSNKVLLSNYINNIDNSELTGGLITLTNKLINLGLRCRYFVLSNILVDIDTKELSIKDRRTIRASNIVEYSDHPDFIDDLDTYFDRLGRDLTRVGKKDIYDKLLVLTMNYMYNMYLSRLYDENI
jgi:hypothetical protein